MSLPLPGTLSPSKVTAFKDCALAFRFSAIEKLPQPPSLPAVRGTLVHQVLERLFWSRPPGGRTREVAEEITEEVWAEALRTQEIIDLELGPGESSGLEEDVGDLVQRYFEMEDPNRVVVAGVELTLEAVVGGLHLRGIIDRLDVDPSGGLVVTDYKTGRVPGLAREQGRLGPLHIYALLCEKVLGVRPARVQLLYLGDGVSIAATPSDQSIRGTRIRSQAVWSAIEKACETEDFRPRPSSLCSYCNFRPWCPAFGGDPSRARDDLGGELPLSA